MWPFKRKDWRIVSAEPKFGYEYGDPKWSVFVRFADGREQFAVWWLANLPVRYSFKTEQEAAACAQWLKDECRR